MRCKQSFITFFLLGIGIFGRSILFAAEGGMYVGGRERVSTSSFSIGQSIRLAELSEQQKRKLFLKAREDLFPVSTTAATLASTASQAAPSVKTTSPPPSVQKKKEPVSSPSSSSSSKKSASASSQKQRTGGAQKKGQVSASKKAPSTAASPSAVSSSSSQQRRSIDTDATARIRVVKSGYQKDEGLVPPPIPSPSKKGFGFFTQQYRYLTPGVRRAIDQAPVKRGRWKYIIIHNSGTRQGNARVFDVYHRRVRHMQNGLAYHFVIGNGRSSGNGQIEVGYRWRKQVNGGHVASDYLNNIAIGICLVGDYNRDSPPSQQLAALEELVSYLQGRVGRFKGRSAIVLGHREINPKPTDCPGRRFPFRWLRHKFPYDL